MVVGLGNCDPQDIYVATTVNKGGNAVKAFKNMKVPVLLCSGHRLNSVIYWALGLGRSYHAYGPGKCKNHASREFITLLAAMTGHFSISTVNNDAFKAVQAEIEGFLVSLELIRRNDLMYSFVRKYLTFTVGVIQGGSPRRHCAMVLLLYRWLCRAYCCEILRLKYVLLMKTCMLARVVVLQFFTAIRSRYYVQKVVVVVKRFGHGHARALHHLLYVAGYIARYLRGIRKHFGTYVNVEQTSG